MNDELAAALTNTFELWDRRPGDPTRARQFEQVVSRVADRVGLSASEVRARLAHRRRLGMGPRAAVADLIRALTPEDRP